MKKLISLYLVAMCCLNSMADNISFVDSKVKELCITYWDTNGDGELSLDEAAAVTSLGDCFTGNDEITSFDELKYFTGLTVIDDYAFTGCLSLTNIQIGNHVQTIGDECFRYCPIRSIVIPESVTAIGEAAFIGCRQLESAVINGPVTILGTGFFGACEKLTSVTLPNTLQEIGDQAFAGCTSLSEIILPEGLKKLDDEVFVDCPQLTTITLPSTLESLSFFCFKDCDQLTHIYVNSATPPTLEEETFSAGTYDKATLHVPAGALAAYQAADIWQDFTNIVESTDDITSVDNKVKISVQAQPNTDIYDLQGKKVGSQATSLKDLPRGIYIIGGEKVVIR